MEINKKIEEACLFDTLGARCFAIEKIADEYAVGFAIYLDNILKNQLLDIEIEKLLEIYKKEIKWKEKN